MSTAIHQHYLPAPLEDVERALLSPEALPALVAAFPEVAEAEELERSGEGSRVVRAARYVARLTPPGFRRLLREPRLTWIERVEWDRAAHAGRFSIAPNLRAERERLFRCDGTYRLITDGEGTRRVAETHLGIDVRVVGPMVEALVLRTLEPHLAIEAEVLTRLATERER